MMIDHTRRALIFERGPEFQSFLPVFVGTMNTYGKKAHIKMRYSGPDLFVVDFISIKNDDWEKICNDITAWYRYLTIYTKWKEKQKEIN